MPKALFHHNVVRIIEKLKMQHKRSLLVLTEKTSIQSESKHMICVMQLLSSIVMELNLVLKQCYIHYQKSFR
ncbi:hypothetical protein LguiB_027978 [Lonicera macranthoides]